MAAMYDKMPSAQPPAPAMPAAPAPASAERTPNPMAAVAAQRAAPAMPQQQPSRVQPPVVQTSAATRGPQVQPAPQMAYNTIPSHVPHAQQLPVDLDVEAVALSAMGTTGMGIDEDDIMAMALGTLDPHHQEWNVSEAALPTSNYTHNNSQTYEPFSQAFQGANAAFSAASYDTASYDNCSYGEVPAGSAQGSRLFERWGQGLGSGGPANSRLSSFVGGDAGSQAAGGVAGYGYGNGFANSRYNGFIDSDAHGRGVEGVGGGSQEEPHRLPLGSRRVMH